MKRQKLSLNFGICINKYLTKNFKMILDEEMFSQQMLEQVINKKDKSLLFKTMLKL